MNFQRSISFMKPLYVASICNVLLFLLLVAVGCSKSSSPLAPLSVEQLPSAMEKAFSKAKPGVKELADQVIASVKTQDYPRAFQGLQNLSMAPGLTKEQSSVAARGMLTVNSLLQSAESKGDQKASATLDNYRRTK